MIMEWFLENIIVLESVIHDKFPRQSVMNVQSFNGLRHVILSKYKGLWVYLLF